MVEEHLEAAARPAEATERSMLLNWLTAPYGETGLKQGYFGMAGRGNMPGFKTGGRLLGTPNKTTADIRAAAAVFGPGAVRKLAELAGMATDADGKPIPPGPPATQFAALGMILDRAHGRALQSISGEAGASPVAFALVTGVVRAHDD